MPVILMRILLTPFLLLIAIHPVPALAKRLEVPSLDPKNRAYLESFCAYHPSSGLCFFTPNPVAKPPYTPPGQPVPIEPVMPIPGGEGSHICMPEPACPSGPVDSSELQQALNSATCGCTIQLQPDTYAATYTYRGTCSPATPLGLEATQPLDANLTGRLNIEGNGLVISGIKVSNGGKIYVNGDNNRITRSSFLGSTPRGAIEIKGARNNEIDHNDFSGSRFIYLGFFVYKTADEVFNTLIHHNYFTGSGEGTGLYIGGYAAELHRDFMLAHANNLATVEYNVFENVRMSKTIHIKSNRNTVRFNYFKHAAPADVRQGQYNIIRGNFVDGGNLGTHEEFNQFLCNRISGGSIDVFAGEGGLTKFGTYQSGTAKDTLVSGNNGRLVLGDIWGLHGKTTPDEPALRTEVRGHTGPIQERFHRDSRIDVNASPVCAAPTSPPVQRSQVGIGAPDTGCQPSGGGGGEPVDCESGEPVEMACPAFKDDLFLNPFNARSAHHRPIGCGARYAGEGDATTIAIKAHAGRGTINAALPFGAAFAKLKASDPIKTVTKTALCGGPGPGIGLPVTIKIPPGWPPGWQSKFRCLDNSTKLYDPETGVTTEFFAFDPSDPGNYRATIARTFDIKGLGHGMVLNQRLGTSASGASTLMGALRAEEVLTPGMPMLHAHHVAVPRLPGHNTPLLLGRGIQWPATAGDGSAYRDATHNTGVFAYGDLLGIPPESKGGPNLDTLGLSEPGRRLAQSFRDYGVYVVDGGPQVVMRATDSLGSRHATMRDDFRKLWPHLRLITNSVAGATAKISASSHSASGAIGTPSWPAGGGTPLAPNCAFDAR